LAFVSNFIPDDNGTKFEGCMFWGSYINVQLQLFIALPIIVLIYRCHSPSAIILLIFLTIGGSLTCGMIIWLQDFMPSYMYIFDIKAVTQYGNKP
jgi:hypothetical protein